MIVVCRHYFTGTMDDMSESTAVLSMKRVYKEFRSRASASSSLASKLSFEGKFIHSFR